MCVYANSWPAHAVSESDRRGKLRSPSYHRTGRQLFVRIDLESLRANMSRSDQHGYSDAEIRQWLLDGGFLPQGGWWRVDERDLAQLLGSEVAEVLPVTGP